MDARIYSAIVEQNYQQLCKEELHLLVQLETVRAAKKHWEDKIKEGIKGNGTNKPCEKERMDFIPSQ